MTIAYCALMAFTFNLLIFPQAFISALEPLHLAFIAGGVAAAAYVGDRLQRGRPLSVAEPEIRLVVVFVGLAALSVPTSFWPGGSVKILTDMLAKSVIVFVLLANVVTTVRQLRGMFWLLTLCSAVPATIMIRNYLQGYLLPVEARIDGYSYGQLTSNPNDVALLLNLVIPLAVALLLSSRSPLKILILLAAIGINAAGIIVTLSRGGFITLATTVLLYLTRLRRGRVWAVLLVLPLLALVLGMEGFVDRMLTSTDVETPGSGQARWEGLKSAFAIVLHYPLFGVGIGQNVLVLGEFGPNWNRWNRVHNVYLEIASEIGIAALVVYVMLLRRCIRSVRDARAWWARERNHGLAHLAQGLQISLIGFAVGAMFHPVAYHFYFYYPAGLAVAVKVLARRHMAAEAVPPRASSPTGSRG